jgi:hypothetical protein
LHHLSPGNNRSRHWYGTALISIAVLLREVTKLGHICAHGIRVSYIILYSLAKKIQYNFVFKVHVVIWLRFNTASRMHSHLYFEVSSYCLDISIYNFKEGNFCLTSLQILF